MLAHVQEPFLFTMPTLVKAKDQYISMLLLVLEMKSISPSVTLPRHLCVPIAMMPVCGAQVKELYC